MNKVQCLTTKNNQRGFDYTSGVSQGCSFATRHLWAHRADKSQHRQKEVGADASLLSFIWMEWWFWAGEKTYKRNQSVLFQMFWNDKRLLGMYIMNVWWFILHRLVLMEPCQPRQLAKKDLGGAPAVPPAASSLKPGMVLVSNIHTVPIGPTF